MMLKIAYPFATLRPHLRMRIKPTPLTIIKMESIRSTTVTLIVVALKYGMLMRNFRFDHLFNLGLG